MAKKIRLYEDIGAMLKRLRGNKPKREVAEALGITLRAYQYLESGERLPRLSMIFKLAEINNVGVYRILQEIEFASPSWEALRPTDIVKMMHELERSLEREGRDPTKNEHDFLDWARLWLGDYEQKLQDRKERREANQPLEGIIRWLVEFWEKASSDDRTWLIVQLKRTFPEYDEWTKSHADAGNGPPRSSPHGR
jgi:transcriptional regulator with XRE-family HTH domain